MKCENVTITYSDRAKRESLDNIAINNIDILIDGIVKTYKPRKLCVDIRVDDEYGIDLPNSILFDKVEEEFENSKHASELKLCGIWKINEYLIIMGIKQ